MASTNEVTGVQMAAILLGTPAVFFYGWWLVAKTCRMQYLLNVLIAHVVGVALGAVCAFVFMVVVSLSGIEEAAWPAYLVGALFAAALAMTHRNLLRRRTAEPAPVPNKVQAETEALGRIGEHGDVRRRSLDAMKRAAAARQRDMTARREKPARPINQVTSDKPVKAFGSPRIVRGERLDKVRFDYLNAKGEYSSRRVLVQMVGEWEFEGIDLDKGDTRTFRYERVVGDITSLNTGEILDPEEWRDSRR